MKIINCILAFMAVALGVMGMVVVVVTLETDCDVKSLILGGLLSSFFLLSPALMFMYRMFKNLL